MCVCVLFLNSTAGILYSECSLNPAVGLDEVELYTTNIYEKFIIINKLINNLLFCIILS